MLTLGSHELLLVVDPRHGAEIVALLDVRSGRQLLGLTPFATTESRAGDLDESEWTAAYRGGWQLLTPNVGNSCRVGGVRHGFHGRASNDPWVVLEAGTRAARLMWSGHGLCVERAIGLVGRRVEVSTTWNALGASAPFIAAEHVAFGKELLDPSFELELAGGRSYEVSEATGPPTSPADAEQWPNARLLTGHTERVDRFPISHSRSRLIGVEGPGNWAVLRNAATGVAVRLSWDAAVYGDLCVWHEARGSGGVWRNMTELLILEPGTVHHPLGLQVALDCHQARWAVADEPVVAHFALEVLDSPIVGDPCGCASSRPFAETSPERQDSHVNRE